MKMASFIPTIGTTFCLFLFFSLISARGVDAQDLGQNAVVLPLFFKACPPPATPSPSPSVHSADFESPIETITTTLTINGSNFDGTNVQVWGPTDEYTPTLVSSTQVELIVPLAFNQSNIFTVTTFHGGVTDSCSSGRYDSTPALQFEIMHEDPIEVQVLSEIYEGDLHSPRICTSTSLSRVNPFSVRCSIYDYDPYLARPGASQTVLVERFDSAEEAHIQFTSTQDSFGSFHCYTAYNSRIYYPDPYNNGEEYRWLVDKWIISTRDLQNVVGLSFPISNWRTAERLYNTAIVQGMIAPCQSLFMPFLVAAE